MELAGACTGRRAHGVLRAPRAVSIKNFRARTADRCGHRATPRVGAHAPRASGQGTWTCRTSTVAAAFFSSSVGAGAISVFALSKVFLLIFAIPSANPPDPAPPWLRDAVARPVNFRVSGGPFHHIAKEKRWLAIEGVQ